jgi:hypothetical protein
LVLNWFMCVGSEEWIIADASSYSSLLTWKIVFLFGDSFCICSKSVLYFFSSDKNVTRSRYSLKVWGVIPFHIQISLSELPTILAYDRSSKCADTDFLEYNENADSIHGNCLSNTD